MISCTNVSKTASNYWHRNLSAYAFDESQINDRLRMECEYSEKMRPIRPRLVYTGSRTPMLTLRKFCNRISEGDQWPDGEEKARLSFENDLWHKTLVDTCWPKYRVLQRFVIHNWLKATKVSWPGSMKDNSRSLINETGSNYEGLTLPRLHFDFHRISFYFDSLHYLLVVLFIRRCKRLYVSVYFALCVST